MRLAIDVTLLDAEDTPEVDAYMGAASIKPEMELSVVDTVSLPSTWETYGS